MAKRPKLKLPKKQAKEQIAIYLDGEHGHKLRTLSEDLEVSYGDVVAALIDFYVEYK